MIINYDREPLLSLYYLGSIILKLIGGGTKKIDVLYSELNRSVDVDINIDFFYYALDWLFLLSIISIEKDEVELCKSTN